MFDDKYTTKYRVTLSGIVLLHFALQNIFVAVSSVHRFLRMVMVFFTYISVVLGVFNMEEPREMSHHHIC